MKKTIDERLDALAVTVELIAQAQLETERTLAESKQAQRQTERALAETSRRLAQTNRVVGKLASMGVGLRSDTRRHNERLRQHEEWLRRHDEIMAEMDGKLNALIDIVDKSIRRNGGR